jgi:hypothetical protein
LIYLFPFQLNFADTGMFIPMILEPLASNFEARATLLYPLRRLPAARSNETSYISNPFAPGNNTGLSQHQLGQSGDGGTPLPT